MQTRLLAIFAALFATVALIAGCSSKSQDSSKALPDAATLLSSVPFPWSLLAIVGRVVRHRQDTREALREPCV